MPQQQCQQWQKCTRKVMLNTVISKHVLPPPGTNKGPARANSLRRRQAGYNSNHVWGNPCTATRQPLNAQSFHQQQQHISSCRRKSAIVTNQQPNCKESSRNTPPTAFSTHDVRQSTNIARAMQYHQYCCLAAMLQVAAYFSCLHQQRYSAVTSIGDTRKLGKQ